MVIHMTLIEIALTCAWRAWVAGMFEGHAPVDRDIVLVCTAEATGVPAWGEQPT